MKWLIFGLLGLMALEARGDGTVYCEAEGESSEGETCPEPTPECPTQGCGLRMCFNLHKNRFGYNGENITGTWTYDSSGEEYCKFLCAIDESCTMITYIFADRWDGSAYCKHHDNRAEIRWEWSDQSNVWRKAPCPGCFNRYIHTKKIGWKWRVAANNGERSDDLMSPWSCGLDCLKRKWCSGFHFKNIGDDAWKGCYLYWTKFDNTQFESDDNEKVDFYQRVPGPYCAPDGDGNLNIEEYPIPLTYEDQAMIF